MRTGKKSGESPQSRVEEGEELSSGDIKKRRVIRHLKSKNRKSKVERSGCATKKKDDKRDVAATKKLCT